MQFYPNLSKHSKSLFEHGESILSTTVQKRLTMFWYIALELIETLTSTNISGLETVPVARGNLCKIFKNANKFTKKFIQFFFILFKLSVLLFRWNFLPNSSHPEFLPNSSLQKTMKGMGSFWNWIQHRLKLC